MPTYRITDPQTGRAVVVSGDSPPTDDEAEQIFRDAGLHTQPASGPISDATEAQLRRDMPLPNSGGALKNFAAGTIEALTSIPGALADMGAAQANAETDYTSPPPVPVGGTVEHYLNRQLGKVDLNPESVTANGTVDRLARAAGYGAATAAMPELALGKGAGIIQRAGKAALVGASSGTGSEAAQEMAPEPNKPIAGLVGGLVAGVPAAAAIELPRAATAASGLVKRALGPVTEAGAQRAAAERLAASATDPDAARASLANVPEYVPGSKATTFQATGDMGLGALERQVQTQNPAEFQQRRSDQNAARLAQLGALQPGGNPADLPDYIRGQIRWLDRQTDQDVADATRVAQGRAEVLGGAQPPESYGASLRASAQEAADTARARERALWRAVDPNGDLTVNASPIRSAAEDIAGSLSQSAKPPQGDEQLILDIARGYSATVPFRDIGDLRSWVSDAMRTELRTNGQTQTYGRLSRLRGAIEGAINGAVEQRAQQAPQELLDGISAFEREAAQWSAVGRARREGASANDASGAGGVSSVPGTQSARVGGFGNTPGDQGVSSPPTFDEAARERLSAATAATRERADTFNRGPVGQVLAKSGRQDQYRLPHASVPAKIFQPGPSGFESVQAYRNAVGDGPAFLTLQDYAASALRQYAGRPDGTLDPARVQAWTARHADALRAFPELAQRFRDAATASDIIGDAMAARRTALDAYQTGVFSKLVGVSNPGDVTRALGGILNSQNRVDQMRQLASAARRNTNAMAGLRKGIADYVLNRFVGNTEAATSGNGTIKADALQTFVKQNDAALRSVFSPEEIGTLKAIAADLQRANRSIAAVRLPGASNAAQDLTAVAKAQPTILGRLLIEGLGTAGGAATAVASGATGPIGLAMAAGGWLGAKALAAAREAGIKRTDDLIRDAMLYPELARALLAKVPAKPDTGSALTLASVLRKSALIGAGVGAATTSRPAQQPDVPPRQASVVRAPEVMNALALPSQNALAAPASSPVPAGNALAPLSSQNALAGPRRLVPKAPPPISARGAYATHVRQR